jgi:hypothetical protein
MTTEEAVRVIKNFCQLAASYNANAIYASYDGSGDSGCMDVSIKHERFPLPTGEIGNSSQRLESDTIRQFSYTAIGYFFKDIIKQSNTLITKEKIDEVEQAMMDLLPGGWEINDGSYGEITADVATGQITVEHNERYTEVNSSTQRY